MRRRRVYLDGQSCGRAPYDAPQFGDIILGAQPHIYPDIAFDTLADTRLVPRWVTDRFADPIAEYGEALTRLTYYGAIVSLERVLRPRFVGPLPPWHGICVYDCLSPMPCYYPVFARLSDGEVLISHHSLDLTAADPMAEIQDLCHRTPYTAVVVSDTTTGACPLAHPEYRDADFDRCGLDGARQIWSVTLMVPRGQEPVFYQPLATRRVSRLRRLPVDRVVNYSLGMTAQSVDDVPTTWHPTAHFRWPHARATIVDGVLGLYRLVGRNVYVYLWIFDWLPGVAAQPEQRKVELIDSILARLGQTNETMA